MVVALDDLRVDRSLTAPLKATSGGLPGKVSHLCAISAIVRDPAGAPDSPSFPPDSPPPLPPSLLRRRAAHPPRDHDHPPQAA